MVMFEQGKLPELIDAAVYNADEAENKDVATIVPQRAKLRLMAPQAEFLQESNL